MKRRGFVFIGLVLAATALMIVFWILQPEEVQIRSKTRPNIVLFSIDTCRADHLSSYGFNRQTTPNIDAIAKEGTLYRHAIAPTSVTLPSHSSMMTGTNPPFHGVHDNQIYRLAESNVTLAEILRDEGYDTGAVVATFVLDKQFGMAQGFDTYDDNMTATGSSSVLVNERRAEQVNGVAKQWLNQRTEKPFFLFLHYYDPHFPYEPPAPFDTTFSGDPYAGEIAYVDQKIGEIKEELVRNGLYDSTMIIITSDHGESLNEHGEATHGWFIYNATTHVPLIIKYPHSRERHEVVEKVALIDIAPTVLGQAGIAVPEDMFGLDLMRPESQRSPSDAQRLIFSESLEPSRYGCSSLLSMQNKNWKYIQTARPELYDLDNDPSELKNLFASRTESEPMRRALQDFLSERTRTDLTGAKQASDPENVKRLEGLGYVGGGQEVGYSFATDKKDPKDFLPVYSQLMRANHLVLKNPDGMTPARGPAGQPIKIRRATLASQICQKILEQDPDVSKAHELLGRLAQRDGQMDQAATHYGHLIRIDPDFAAAYIDLGGVLKSQGKTSAAEERYRTAIEILTRSDTDESDIDTALDRSRSTETILLIARQALAQLLMDEDRIEESAREFTEVLKLNPRHVKAHTVIALDHYQKKRLDQAVDSLNDALSIDPEYKPALRMIASIEKARGTIQEP